MFLSTGIFVIAVGIFCISDNELAWNLYELDNRLMGIYVERPKNWRDRVYYMGTTLIFLGAVAVVLGVKMLA
jgi:hypothetical protein